MSHAETSNEDTYTGSCWRHYGSFAAFPTLMACCWLSSCSVMSQNRIVFEGLHNLDERAKGE